MNYIKDEKIEFTEQEFISIAGYGGDENELGIEILYDSLGDRDLSGEYGWAECKCVINYDGKEWIAYYSYFCCIGYEVQDNDYSFYPAKRFKKDDWE